MPIVSTFFGIIIRMYFDDHNPPHFHAEFQGQEAKFDFDGRILEGEIGSATARKLIRKWAESHQKELSANWTLARNLKPLKQIPPLE
jgi:hypothetical protein